MYPAPGVVYLNGELKEEFANILFQDVRMGQPESGRERNSGETGIGTALWRPPAALTNKTQGHLPALQVT